MKKYLLLLILLIPFVVHADATKYNVVINNDNISVSIVDGGNVSNYSNIVTYQNRVLTVHEGVTINELDYNDIDITITSNDKIAYIGTIKGDNQRHNTLTIKNFKNDENTPFELYTWTLYAQINIEDSTIYRANIRNKDSDENIEYGATIKNTKIYNCSQINMYICTQYFTKILHRIQIEKQ